MDELRTEATDEATDEATEGRSGRAAERRVRRELPAGSVAALESGLPLTDVSTLLLSVMRARAARVTPSRVLDRWQQDRFVRPSDSDPRQVSAVEATSWRLLPDRFVGVELSPVAPLGLCSAVAPVDQHRVVSTVRGSEVLSDPTNALAVEAALRRRGRPANEDVDLAASHRVLRAQRFGPGEAAHFRLFALVSSGRDRGSRATETDLVLRHVRFWQDLLAQVLPGVDTWITMSVFGDPVLAERRDDTLLPGVREAPVRVVPDDARTHARGYYDGLAIGLRADVHGRTLDIGDGGLTRWTAQLLGDAKERCFVSCVATERLAALATAD